MKVKKIICIILYFILNISTFNNLNAKDKNILIYKNIAEYMSNLSPEDRVKINISSFKLEEMEYIENNVKFKIEDYLGIWRDPENRRADLSLSKTGFNKYFIKSNWGDGTCKAIKRKKNILLLECNGNFVPSGNFKDTIVREYIGLNIHYNFFTGSIIMTTTFSPDKRCALIGSASEKDNCSFYEEHVTGKYGVDVIMYGYYKLIHGEKPSFWEYD